MILDTSEGIYRAHSKHERKNGQTETVCSVHQGRCASNARPCGTPDTLTGTAKLSKHDVFCRATGRKVAFTKALASLPRELRRALWQSYLAQHPVVRTKAA